jgi:hypothetical protein
MPQHQIAIDENELRRLLIRAAVESEREAERYCVGGGTLTCSADAPATAHEEALAWLAAGITEDAWRLLTRHEPDAQAVLAWTIQEVIEWTTHAVRMQHGDDADCWTPITWLPVAKPSSLEAVVEERLSLLRQELLSCGVEVRDRGAAEEAA